jgi:hypothetical protein
MKPGGGRGKGSAFERLLAKRFQKWSGSEVRRTPLSGGWAKEAKFQAKGDLVSTDPDFPFSVEAKKQEKWVLEHLLYTKSKIFSWWNQCQTESPKGKIPLLVFSKNRSQIFAMIRVRDFKSLGGNLDKGKYLIVKTPKTGRCLILLLGDFLKRTPYPKKSKE